MAFVAAPDPRLRVAVSGPTDLDAGQRSWLRRQLDLVIRRSEIGVLHTLGRPMRGRVDVAILSALAPGVDHVGARLALRRPGFRLAAVLPAPAAEYAQRFDPKYRVEWQTLVDRAAVEGSVYELDGPFPQAKDAASSALRQRAYARANHVMAVNADLVFVVLDLAGARARGGAAGMMREALLHKRDVAWIPLEGGRLQAWRRLDPALAPEELDDLLASATDRPLPCVSRDGLRARMERLYA